MHWVNLLLLTCMSIVGFVSAANPACQVCQKYKEWVEKACSGDGVCGPANSKCYKGKCLCAVGFYYSVGSRTCVNSCTDLQADSYIAYPEGGIHHNNVYVKSGTSEYCKQVCSKDPKCQSTERKTDSTCHFHHVAASASNWEEGAGWIFYQKNCA